MSRREGTVHLIVSQPETRSRVGRLFPLEMPGQHTIQVFAPQSTPHLKDSPFGAIENGFRKGHIEGKSDLVTGFSYLQYFVDALDQECYLPAEHVSDCQPDVRGFR
jgi:hypothetical protein